MARRRHQCPSVLIRKGAGRRYYYMRYRVDVIGANKQPERVEKKRFLGYADGPDAVTKQEAKRKRDEFLKTINATDYVIQSHIPFRDFAVIYKRQHFPTLAASSQAAYECLMERHILPEFGRLRLLDVDLEHVEAWLHRKETEKLSYATRGDLRKVLSSIYTQATRWGYWRDKNPAHGANLGRKRSVREPQKLTTEQVRLFLEALPDDLRLMVELALSTTVRISEILGLQEKHLNFANGMIAITQRFYRGDLDVPKNSKPRIVPMGMLIDRLRGLITGNAERFVFAVKTCRGYSRDDRDINQHFLRPAAKALGIYWLGFGWHQFRREAITALGGEADIAAIMRLAGHSSADMTLHYTLADRVRHEAAVRAVQERLLGHAVTQPVH